MDSKHHLTDSGSNLYLTGSILLASLDSGSLADYTVKAFIGAATWMLFRLASDFINEKMKKK